MKPVDLVLGRFAHYERRNGYYMARCPTHDDPKPSLSIKEGDDGRVLLHCFADCETTRIVTALGLDMSDLFPSSKYAHNGGQEKTAGEPTATWEIRDVAGELQALHVRFDRDGGKECLWRLPDDRGWGLKGRKLSTLPLYGSERVSEWPEDIPVIVAEGEKATDALLGAGFAALGTVTGAAGTPGQEALEAVRGRRVVLWPDNDEEGRRHMKRVAEGLQGIASEVRLFEWAEAPPKGDAADHPAVISRSRKAVAELLEEMASAPVWEPGVSSSSSLTDKGNDNDDDALGLVWFSNCGEPQSRVFLVEDVVPADYMTTIHGSGGVAKSILALSLGIVYTAGLENWLGLGVYGNGAALYLDFELDADEQLRRVRDLCAGLRVPVPNRLCYLSALGRRTSEALSAALTICRRHDVGLLILDSLGPAMLGDAERAKDFIAFYNEYLVPFREAGVTVLVIDHQGKLQAGEKYQDKTAFGTAYKSHLSRSVIQVERIRRDRDAQTLTVRLRHTKTNFGPQRDPLDVELAFRPGSTTVKPTEVDATELAREGTLNAEDRILLALHADPAFPDELAEVTSLAVGTVKNYLTRLKKRGQVEYTGEVKGRAQQVRLASSSSRPLYDGDDDDGRDRAEREDEEFARTGIIQSERQVFELAHKHFGAHGGGGAK